MIVGESILYDAPNQTMREMRYTPTEAPPSEFEASGGLNPNVLVTAPKQAIAIDGFPKTLELMREVGCELAVFKGNELSIPCECGST